jgi:hypothetical protein
MYMPSGNGDNPPAQLLSFNWISLALELFRGAGQFPRDRSHEGINEMLEFDAARELLDTKGEAASLRKRQRVRFLQDNVIAL